MVSEIFFESYCYCRCCNIISVKELLLQSYTAIFFIYHFSYSGHHKANRCIKIITSHSIIDKTGVYLINRYRYSLLSILGQHKFAETEVPRF